MIITQEVSSPVTIGGGITTSKFKIKASAKAFKILSGFYSEPILAIPRELGANAWDSHVAAGNTNRMFEVHAPNSLEPWFSIRDFGTGLSPDAIDQIYTTYFESTKIYDNNSDGCMGLGSKTPFNYTENFSVISRHNGMKYVYNCFIDQNGAPNITEFAREMTVEHNGLEIKFSVKASDISLFVEKIKQAFEPFRYKPVITGATIVYPLVEYAFEGKNWAMRKTKSQSYSNTSRAFMGNYSYPINISALYGSSYNCSGYDERNFLDRASVDLFFEIGDLDVAPNKEQLQYDVAGKTQNAIISAAKAAFAELKEKVKKSLAVPKTRWEAMFLYNKYNGYNSEFHNLVYVLGEIPVSYKGKQITGTQLHFSEIDKDSKINYEEQKFQVTMYSSNRRNGFGLHKTRVYRNYSLTDPAVVFLYTSAEDKRSFKRSRVLHYLKTNFLDKNLPTPSIYYVVDETGKGVMESHVKYLEIPDNQVIDIESLPKPPRRVRAPKSIQVNEVNFFGVNYNYWSSKSLTVDAAGTYYYVDFHYTSPMYKKAEISRHELSQSIAFAVSKKIFDKTVDIFGVNKKNRHLLKTGTWINAVDYIKEKIKPYTEELAHDRYLNEVYIPGLQTQRDILRRLRQWKLSAVVKGAASKYLLCKLETIAEPVIDRYIANGFEVAEFFKISAQKKSSFDDSALDTLQKVQTKYMNLFDLIEGYNPNLKKLANIIDFIDENS